jgi:hypothetical protein
MDPKTNMDVPLQVREFAQKSVDQAERAMSSFMEAASKSVATVPTPMNDVAKQALAIAEANVKASFEHALKLMQAISPRLCSCRPSFCGTNLVWQRVSSSR